MAKSGKTPTPSRNATVHRFPASERGRRMLQARGQAARWVLPPPPAGDGAPREWRSWRAIELRCEHCHEKSYPRVHLVLSLGGSYGSYTLWTMCPHCHYLREEMAVARLRILDMGQRLDGWTPAGSSSLLERREHRLNEIHTQRRQRTMTANYGKGGGDRGA